MQQHKRRGPPYTKGRKESRNEHPQHDHQPTAAVKFPQHTTHTHKNRPASSSHKLPALDSEGRYARWFVDAPLVTWFREDSRGTFLLVTLIVFESEVVLISVLFTRGGKRVGTARHRFPRDLLCRSCERKYQRTSLCSLNCTLSQC